jgi:UDP-glucose 6-dehydrogenase
VFIAVATPSRRGDGYADVSYVHMAAREIAAAVAGFTVVVTKSTVPVGTGDEVERILAETRPEPTGGGVQSGISAGGGDVQRVAPGIGLANRIGQQVRGSCFPKDKVALIKTAQDAEAPLRITLRSESMSDARTQEICSVAEALAPLVDDVCAT